MIIRSDLLWTILSVITWHLKRHSLAWYKSKTKNILSFLTSWPPYDVYLLQLQIVDGFLGFGLPLFLLAQAPPSLSPFTSVGKVELLPPDAVLLLSGIVEDVEQTGLPVRQSNHWTTRKLNPGPGHNWDSEFHLTRDIDMNCVECYVLFITHVFHQR